MDLWNFNQKKKEDNRPEEATIQLTSKVEGFINNELNQRLMWLNEAFTKNDKKVVEQAFKKTMDAYEAKVSYSKPVKLSNNTYLFDYAFLHTVNEHVTQDEKEGYCLITGPEFGDNLFALTRMIKPKMARRSIAGAEPDFGHMADTLMDMEKRYGSRLTAYAHSHPGKGQAATAPSSIDLNTQRKYEAGGYPVVGLIFSRDGYVRFFTKNREFEVQPSGKGGAKLSHDILKLD